MIKIDHWWGSKATAPVPICLPFIAAMTNATSGICHNSFSKLPPCYILTERRHISGVGALPVVTTHRLILLICEVDLPLNTLINRPLIHYGSLCCLFFVCPGGFYSLVWIYDCDAAVALKPSQCEWPAEHLCFLTAVLQVRYVRARGPSWLCDGSVEGSIFSLAWKTSWSNWD